MNLKLYGIAAFLACSILHVNAGQHGPNGFEIKGHISGIENGTKVYLIDIDGQVYMDSTTATGGHFNFRGHVSRPTSAWIRCGTESAVIQLENTHMTFEAPMEHMALNAVATGGREQGLQNELNAKQLPYNKNVLKAYDSIMNKQYASDADKDRLIKIFSAMQDTAQQLYIDFGKRHPDSYLGLDIIYRNRQTIGKDTVKFLCAAMGKGVSASPKAQALHVFLDNTLAVKGASFIDFDAKTLDGNAFKLSSLKGKYILLDFWSAGCGPCRMQNRKMSEEYAQLKDKLTVVNFSLDEHKANWLKSSADDHIAWTNVSDLKGEGSHIKMLYDVQAIPTSFLINKEGVIVEKFVGYDDDDFINRLVQLTQEK